ncbi:MAG TPA: hypothetical protein VGW40_08110 [Allosphingosinicella sp.]|nr:hypothetical protein [Allosphingosinicella sp.]
MATAIGKAGGGMADALSAQKGSGAGKLCFYAGVQYSPGSRLCQVKKVKVCQSDGTWGDPASGPENC